MLKKLFSLLFVTVISLAVAGQPCWAVQPGAADLLIEDFESPTYSGWTITGQAFGHAPARGTLANQMEVSGYRGEQLVNTFFDGDRTVGTATSEPFTIERSNIAFLIGGGPHRDSVGIELLLGDQPVRTQSGPESESLQWASWDVNEYIGQQVRLRIFDRATGGWGHINIDHIIQTNSPPDRFDLEQKLAQYRASTDYMNEPLRPQVHFSPEINWMNDPNGLVYHRGEYHLFHQYNPAGNSWGHMSWGHAVSRDLMHWQHLPLAIPEVDGVMAFSGCCVVDHQNSSGFGRSDLPPLVAIYTGHGHGKQVQNLAFSNDDGRTWTLYSDNPVIDIHQKDFRDPKVFWHPPTERWVMVVSLAAEKILVFYSSPDLKMWTERSRFGPAGVESKPNWECPDLFPLPVEGEPGKELWVLEADMGSGSVAGGSGGEYFVGTFDGSEFTPMSPSQWVDFGRDFYAPISWSDIPKTDGRRIWIGWFNNWETCLVPTSPWRSCMSLPRTLSLRKVDGAYRLIQRPVKELETLRSEFRELDTSAAAWPPMAVTDPGELNGQSFELETVLHPGTARSCGFRIRTGESEFIEVGYDRESGAVYVDRRQSGNVTFHPAFAGRHEAPVEVTDNRIDLRLFVDRSTIEVFINDGAAVISDLFFPTSQNYTVEAFCGDPSAKIESTKIWNLDSIWRASKGDSLKSRSER